VIETQKVFLDFWSQFKHPTTGNGILAFLDGYATIPDEQGRPTAPNFPYITFTLTVDPFSKYNINTARVWTRASIGFSQVVNILGQISDAIPDEGVILNLSNGRGAIKLDRSTPFIQYQSTENTSLIAGHVSLVCRSYVL
jgi:hypothetical protein